MTYVNTKSVFHVALNGIGLLLQGAPDRLGYQQIQAPVYGSRFASGDRSYNDLSQWWYFVQTDWSGGIKDDVSWEDDASYYYSTNINAYSEPGSFKLSARPVQQLQTAQAESAICGILANVGGTAYKYIGTDDASTDNRPNLYRALPGIGQAFTEILGTTVATTRNLISQISNRNGILWVSFVGSNTTETVKTYDGGSWTDQAGFIVGGPALSVSPNSSRCHTTYGNTLYAFVDVSASNYFALVKTTVINPSSNAHWSLVFERTSQGGTPIAAAGYNGNIYYILNFGSYYELRAYDLTTSTDSLIRTFHNTSSQLWGLGDKLLVELNGILLVTVPPAEIWAIAGNAITRIYTRDGFKSSAPFQSYTSEILANLEGGCIVSDNKAWWGNLMFDGEKFFNTWKTVSDSLIDRNLMLFADETDIIWQTDSNNASFVYYVDPKSTMLKGTAGKNFLVFNQFDNISGVDKLMYSFTILFKPLLTGESIIVEYLFGELAGNATWTTLGTASFAIDGGSVKDKTFYFGDAAVAKKMWVRIKLEGSGSTSPTFTDSIVEYLPVPTYKKSWTLNINASDTLKTLTGRQVTKTGRELRAQLENAWWTKSLMDFQDFDYATTVISGGTLNSSDVTVTVASTLDFPEQGRIKVDAEEIIYTGKTQSTFTGCVRGARGTRAVSHTNGTVLNNAYKVLITDLQTRVPVALQDKEMEYIVTVGLKEA